MQWKLRTTRLCLLLDGLRATGLCPGKEIPLMVLSFKRLGLEILGWIEEEGVDEPCREFKVEEDWVVETVGADRSEFLELFVFGGFSVFWSVFLRLSSLKNGMVFGIPTGIFRDHNDELDSEQLSERISNIIKLCEIWAVFSRGGMSVGRWMDILELWKDRIGI